MDAEIAGTESEDLDINIKTDNAYEESATDVLSTLGDMPITEHLIELRRHLIKICVAVLVIFLALAGFSRELYNFLSDPLVAQLPANSTMIATDITSNFMAPIRLTVFVAAFFAMPYILYQIWSFVAPGLYKREENCDSSTTLLYIFILCWRGFFLFYCAQRRAEILHYVCSAKRLTDDRYRQLSELCPKAVYGIWVNV
ncbi:hypothetical protein Psyaliredsea_31040 [Psychrobacter alimentarius]